MDSLAGRAAATIKHALLDKPDISLTDGANLLPRGLRAEGGPACARYAPAAPSMTSPSWRPRERERTGHKEASKSGYNRVFGYYIDVPDSADAAACLPEDYIRKQTLVSSERYRHHRSSRSSKPR